MTEATQTPMLEIRDIKRDYRVPQGMFKQDKIVHAVKGVSFKLDKGKTLAIVGESGCGKSTLARILTFIDEPTAGELLIDGQKVDTRPGHLTADMRQKVQIVFQNPYGSLNPRQKIGHALEEPLLVNTTMSAKDRTELKAWHSYTGDEDPPEDRKPDHGTSKAQFAWLERGLDSGDFASCNTWTASAKSIT